jgi:hypothetical protein
VFISKAVQDGKGWITLVTHDLSDGAWQILGETGIETEGPELVTWYRKIRRWKNSPIFQRAGVQSDQPQEVHGRDSREDRKKPMNESKLFLETAKREKNRQWRH